MGIKSYAIGALVLVAVGAAVGWYRTEMARARAQGRIEVLSVQIDRQVEDYTAFRDSVAERDSARSRELARLAEQADSLDSELTLARRQAQASTAELDSLLAQSSIPDSILRAVSAAMASLRKENEICTLALRNCRDQVGTQIERSSDYERQLIKADSVILIQRQLISNLENMGQRSTLLPWIVAGAAVAIAGAVIVF